MLPNYRFIVRTLHYFYIVLDYSWFLELHLNRYKLLIFLQLFIHQVLFFGVLVTIFASLIVDLFVRIGQIIVCWYWNLSSGVISNCLWYVYKPDIQIFFPYRFVEGRGEVSGWVFRILCFNPVLALRFRKTSS